MRGRAVYGLLWVALASAPAVLAHAQGVSHTYENGAPVITVRLVPAGSEIAKGKRIDALDPAAVHAVPTSDEAAGTEVAPPDAAMSFPADENGAALSPEPANELPGGEQALGPDASTPVSRYPTARPAMKPNTETGVGGALDLAPPPAAEEAPRPMRLNSVQRPRNVAERARPQREQRARPPRVRAEAPPASEPDPLDEALPPRVVDAPVTNAMQLPPVKLEERLAGGN